MSRVTVSITDEEEAIIEANVGDGGAYESKSAFLRACMQAYERVDDLEEEVAALRRERDQLESDVERVEDLETEVERLRQEKRQLLSEREEKAKLAQYVEDERRVEQQWREASIVTRLKWRVVGMPSSA